MFLAVTATLHGGMATAAENEADTQRRSNTVATLDSVIVTGTRETGRKAEDSPVPIDVVPSSELVKTGQSSLLKALEKVLPSFTRTALGGDTSDLVKTGQLRGLSPDHLLVLVNGKRRHNSANLNLVPGPIGGSNPVDLDLIPVSTIDHIEVLRDGAAAQYGSDAIAGVINIILKSSSAGGSLNANAGQYYEGDGLTKGAGADAGVALGENGFLHVGADARDHNNSNRSGPDQRQFYFDGDAREATVNKNTNRWFGDPESQLQSFGFNAGYALDAGIEFYGFGTYAHREATAWQPYREPANDSNVRAIYPEGFSPAELLDEDDFAITLGVKGGNLFGWNWDASSTYGRDNADIGTKNTLNPSLGLASPTHFHNGEFVASQWTDNFDLTRAFSVAFLPAPLHVATGVEWRHETFEINAGEAASYINGGVPVLDGPNAGQPTTAGSVGYRGFGPLEASDNARDSGSVYVDLSTNLTPQWQAAAAVRYEHYSDFGETTNGKLTTRYDFSKQFALRGAIQTGFRAPSLAQQFYSLTASGPGFSAVQTPVSSDLARALGSKPLDAEKSKSFSLGAVLEPLSGWHITADAYLIDINDRIVNSAFIFAPGVIASVGGYSPDAILAGYFTNALDTRTKGIDITTDYTSDLDNFGSISWSLAANFNNATIRHIKNSPAQVAALGQSLINESKIADLTSTAPEKKITLGIDYSISDWLISLHETYYGSTDAIAFTGVAQFDEPQGEKYITDLEIGFSGVRNLYVGVGAQNLFDEKPDRSPLAASGPSGSGIYPISSAIGINGGYYYSRVAYTF